MLKPVFGTFWHVMMDSNDSRIMFSLEFLKPVGVGEI